MKKHQSEERNFFKALFFTGVIGTSTLILSVGAVIWSFSRGLPQIISVADYHPMGVTRILGRGITATEIEVIGEFYKERRYLVPFEKIPTNVVRAFLAAEDDRFYEHPGINIVSIIRAGIANFRAGHVVQGGSTITQQVAKSLLLTSERSFDRKIKEVILAYRIEKNLTKNQILYLYLNQIYLGHGAYGVQAASQTYFGKDVSKITIAEAALLAGLPQAPSKYSPLLNPKRAKERQLYVLRRMMENRFISQIQLNQSTAESVFINKDIDLNGKFAPYLVEHTRRHLIEKFGEKKVYEEGLTVTLPISAALASSATKHLKSGLLALDKRIGFRGPVKHLDTQADVEKFITESRQQLVDAKIHGKLLLPDGTMDTKEALKRAKINSDAELIEPGELYEAVVTGFDRAKKSALISLGGVAGELPISQMKWARKVKEGMPPNSSLPPNEPWAVLKRGDVILVSRVAGSPVVPLQVALEQKPQVQGALVSMEVKTGRVLAMVGGYDFDSSEFNRAVQAMRQPGSAFKPIIYAAALEKGFSPASVIVDSPIVFKDTDGQGSWKPNNYEEKFYGDTTFRQALIKSRNIPTVKIVQSVQVPFLIDFSRRLGMSAQFNADLSIALGSATVTPLELLRVYALFPRLGRKIEPIFIQRVEDRDGAVLEEPSALEKINALPALPVATFGSSSSAAAEGGTKEGTPQNIPQEVPPTTTYPLATDPAQVLDPRVACVMTHLMKEVVTFGTGHAALGLGRPSAGKTGTTNESVDAWFLGFTPQVVTGVWVGFDNQKTLGPGETGAKAALPIWLDFMREATKDYPVEDFAVPKGVIFANINPTSGKLVPPHTPGSIQEAFVEGTEPKELGNSVGSGSKEEGNFFKEDRE